jgi:hypothetical protein
MLWNAAMERKHVVGDRVGADKEPEADQLIAEPAAFHLIVVRPYLLGLELRASHHLYRVSRDGNVLEAIRASALPFQRLSAVDTRDPAYQVYFRQLPGGLTPGQVSAGSDRRM